MINRVLSVLMMALALVTKDYTCYIAAGLFAVAAAVEGQ